MDSRLESVLAALAAMLVADPTLTGAPLLNGQHVYLRMSSELVQDVPSIQYYGIDQGIDENFETAVIRWEIWADTLASVMAIQRRLIFLLHREGSLTLAGARVISQVETAYDGPDTEQLGLVRRVVESRLEIVRLRATA